MSNALIGVKNLLNAAMRGNFLEKQPLLSLPLETVYKSLDPSELYCYFAYVLGKLDYRGLACLTAGTKNPAHVLRQNLGRIGFLSGKFSTAFVSSQAAYAGVIPFDLIEKNNLFLIQTKPLTRRCEYYSRHSSATYVEIQSEAELYELVISQKIDVLVDLTGSHWKVFSALRASRVSRFSAFATFGICPNVYDYHLLSADTAPSESTEAAKWQFDFGSFVTTKRAFVIPCPFGSFRFRAATNRKSDEIIFGVFSRPSKWTIDCVRVWSKILSAHPHSCVYISFIGIDSDICVYIADVFAKFGITTDRLVFLAQTSQDEHRRKLENVDVYLDAFPQGGGLQIMEALSCGLPMVVMDSEDYMFNPAPAILRRFGLGHLVAKDEDEYVTKAIALASDVFSAADRGCELREWLVKTCADKMPISGLALDGAFREDFLKTIREALERNG